MLSKRYHDFIHCVSFDNIILTKAEILQTLYASDILYVVTHGLAKISVLQLLERLAVVKWHQKVAKSTSIFIGAWMLVSVLVLALRCGVSHPWTMDSRKCINMVFSFGLWRFTSLQLLTPLVPRNISFTSGRRSALSTF